MCYTVDNSIGKGAHMQKGYIVYYDNLKYFDRLDDEQLGRLFRGLTRYAATGEEPDILDPAAGMLFEVMANQVDRDAEHYRQVCAARTAAGKKGAAKNHTASDPAESIAAADPLYSDTRL